MEIIRIIPSESKLWNEVWKLYTESFPDHERRRVSSHTYASDDQAFHTYIAVENGHLLALLFYWVFDGYIYIEHVAVNPGLRSKNIGSSMIRRFLEQNRDSVVILEIDPAVDEIAKRRQAFYQRLGFVDTGFSYTHPSYSKKGQAHELRLMSYHKAISEQEYETFKEFIFGRVLMYTD